MIPLMSHGPDPSLIPKQNGRHDWRVGPYLLALMDINIMVVGWTSSPRVLQEEYLSKKGLR